MLEALWKTMSWERRMVEDEADQFAGGESCIKVALDFVSPENVGDCINLAEEFRKLPPSHRAKEDKLEVKKMTFYAMCEAVKTLDEKCKVSKIGHVASKKRRAVSEK
ncbi:hypothetical protein FNV43_RR00546 [Rhamnella rubrinervis]|uniref:Uncharacterized protein n=1 Tax=Rhamnella rubrinervis TaxID=2594499 RepID=A0A8K0HPD7_9ROSA|nr:hypothetical protein FNV43_RR00546 [Rhamnella rubrinervis]